MAFDIENCVTKPVDRKSVVKDGPLWLELCKLGLKAVRQIKQTSSFHPIISRALLDPSLKRLGSF